MPGIPTRYRYSAPTTQHGKHQVHPHDTLAESCPKGEYYANIYKRIVCVRVYLFVCLLIEYALTANPRDTFFGLYTHANFASIICNVSLTFNKALFLFTYMKKKSLKSRLYHTMKLKYCVPFHVFR